ncbi:MAG: biotin carboxyl carrier protein [Deltaproteobacteria bacterium]|nr:biotin carboxyl carrier protein [Deltaproteobacteria bacterium]
MEAIHFVDTTIRDGHQSLWAENMTTGMMLPIARNLDNAGFEGIELIAGSHLKKTVRELKEDPWERVRLMSKLITKTPLRVISGPVNSFEYNPPSMFSVFLERMAAYGIREARTSDEWNDYESWKFRAGVAHSLGLRVILNLIYSVSPKHTDEYFAERTRRAASLKPYRLCLKDPGGLLTPERMQSLVPVIFKNAGGIPVELHTHCTTGLGPLCCLEAMKLGICSINTALPPLADDSSNPSLFNVAKNARALGYTTAIDEEILKPVSRHFTAIAKREGFTIGAPVEYDYAQYQHQVPGGMLSNLRHQLGKVGLEHKFPEALEETIRVRKEFGYPIMVTPLSQFVGSQAAINVIVGERYKEVTDQAIKFALGHAGAEGARDMDPDVKDRILDRPRAKEWAKWQPDDPTPDEMRCRLNAEGTSDEELLLRWIVGKEDIDAMRANPRPLEYLNSDQPLVNLLHELAKRTKHRQIHVRTAGFSVTLEKTGASAAITHS